jgi:hypothetical protein
VTKSDARNGFRVPPPPFTAFAHLEGNRATVVLHGELDAASISILIDAILIDCFPGISLVVEGVVLDFAELDFIDGCWSSQPATRANLLLPSRPQRDPLGLTLLGEHSHRQAARRVGLSEDIAAKMITAAIAHRPLQRLLDIVDFERIVAI